MIEKRSSYETIKTAALIASLNFEHQWTSGDTFEAFWYVIPYLDYTERSPMRLQLTYAHPIQEHLDITAGFLWDYVPDPPGDIKPYDTKLTFGIRWRK